MDTPEVKRHKWNDESVPSNPKILSDVVNWQNQLKIAIEYHVSLRNRIEITYNSLYDASKRIEGLLKDCCSLKFIGISPEVSAICIPALMIGINLSNNAFVCLQSPSLNGEILDGQLKIEYFFAKRQTENTELIKELRIHDESLLFLKFKQCLPKNSFKGKNIYAYAVTTSGSTGDPVVVRVTHASIIPNILDLKNILELSSKDKVTQLVPLTFDPSVIEIFITLSCSGTLFITSAEVKNDPQKLLALVLASNVTIMQSTPSLLMHRWSSNDLSSTLFGVQSHLRILLLGGELFPSPQILFNLKHPQNKCRFFNIYGITEVSCWASINEILSESNPRDLGRVLSKTVFEVRNKGHEIVSEGQGQLFIGSYSRICLIKDEIMEKMVFPVFRGTGDLVTINKGGKIFLNGRKNRQVKRFGNRLNLQDLENHVNQLDFVESSHAIFVPNKQSLHIFFTSRYESQDENDGKNMENNVLKHVKKLSAIYEPDEVNLIESFPLTMNGKICMHSLKRICKISHEKIDTSDSVKVFQAIWRNYLDRQDSGFVEIGGTSVIALQIANDMSQKTGNEYPELIGRMLRNETFESCAVYISQAKLNVGSKIVDSGKAESSNTIVGIAESHEMPIIQKSGAENEWLWQKCRGRIIFNDHETSENAKISQQAGDVGKISMKKSYDLLKCVDAAPTIFCYDRKTYATVGSHSGIICTVELTEKDVNEESWKAKLPDRIEASILVENNFRGIVGCYDGFLYCTDLRSGEILWKFKTGDAVKCSAVFCSQRRNVFFGSYDHCVYAVSLKDGTEVWKAELNNGSISATPVVHHGTNSVLLGTLDGTCVSLDQISGNIRWICHLPHPIFSAPVISRNECIIFCDVSGVLTTFDIDSGNQKWRMEIEGNVFSHLVLQKDRNSTTEKLIVTSRNRNLYVFEIESNTEKPKLKNQMEFSSPIIATPWADDQFITIAGTKGELLIINSETCDIVSTYEFPREVYSSPVVHKDFIVIGCRDNNLYILLRK